MNTNVDPKTVEGFGQEWSRFRYDKSNDDSIDTIFCDYTGLFPFNQLNPDAICLDVGCGTGRWAMRFAPRVGELHLLDASPVALQIAKDNLQAQGITNVAFIASTIHDYAPPIRYDAAYSLGVLHHIPDTQQAIRDIAAILKPDAPFLLYLYYRLDNRPFWFRKIFTITDFARRVISTTPFAIRHRICDLIAILIYFPLAQIARALAACRIPFHWIPLAYYRDKSFYVMRTDALDRFGTRLEHRFTKNEIQEMLTAAGFDRISFSSREPYWTAICHRRNLR